jgi:two-component sensor histidine kinase
MVNELVTNSIKYAFLNQTNPNINIEFNKLKTGSFRLSYNDNGCGLPEKINPKKSTTLGLKLIQLLTKQLNGTMDTENRNGAFFYFYFEALK